MAEKSGAVNHVNCAHERRVLLICPVFFSYQQIIAEGLASLGYRVDVLDDRASSGTGYKMALRVLPSTVAKWSEQRFEKWLTRLPINGYEHVVVVKGEALSEKTTALLRKRFWSARMSLYLWDSITNAPNAQRSAHLYDYVATFDPEDAERHDWQYRPLFGHRAQANTTNKRYDWSFIGTIHSDRYRVIRKLQANSEPSVRSFVYGYFPSRSLYLYHGLRTPSLWWEPRGSFGRKSIDFGVAQRVVRQSIAVLDVEHTRQKGLTIRSIEALISGRKLITTNQKMTRSALYHPTRVQIIDRQKPLVPMSFFATELEPLPADVRYAYSLECWARTVLGMEERTRY